MNFFDNSLQQLVFCVLANSIQLFYGHRCRVREMNVVDSGNLGAFFFSYTNPSLVFAWASTWQLPINRSNSQHLHLGPITYFSPYEITACKIPQLKTITEFGITIN